MWAAGHLAYLRQGPSTSGVCLAEAAPTQNHVGGVIQQIKQHPRPAPPPPTPSNTLLFPITITGRVFIMLLVEIITLGLIVSILLLDWTSASLKKGDMRKHRQG